jgi:hypothetical protein
MLAGEQHRRHSSTASDIGLRPHFARTKRPCPLVVLLEEGWALKKTFAKRKRGAVRLPFNP